MIIGREKTTKVEEMQANHPFFIIFTSIARHLASIATSLRQVAYSATVALGYFASPTHCFPKVAQVRCTLAALQVKSASFHGG